MPEEHLPFGPATAIGEIAPDLPPPPARVEPLPRPRDDEPKPFSAARHEQGWAWLVAYA